MQRCLNDLQTGQLSGDPQTLCIGNAGDPPSHPQTGMRLAVAEATLREGIAARCSDALAAALRLCQQADTLNELQDCIVATHASQARVLLQAEYGALSASSDAAEQRCQARIAQAGRRYLKTKLRAVQHCLNQRNRQCLTGDAAARCIGALRDDAHVPPTHRRTAGKIARAAAALRKSLATSCDASTLARLDACGSDPDALVACMVRTHWVGSTEMIQGQYGGAHVFADPAVTLQGAVDAAEPDQIVLLDPGTYSEAATVNTRGLTLRGQKGCKGERAVLVNPEPGHTPNGIQACGTLVSECGFAHHEYGEPDPGPGIEGQADGLTFEGFEVREFDDNGIFVTGAEGVTFRDMIAVGPGTAGGMEYGLFPVSSRDVLVEDSLVIGVSDAGIYVGGSEDIVVRRNEVFGNVAGIEIENSVDALVEDNYAHDNTGGILIFKLVNPPLQRSDCHVVRNNRIENNNVPNFGSGIVGIVPRGTGLIVLSNDFGVFENNTITGNDTFGMVITDQQILDLLFGAFGGVLSADFLTEDNFFIDNTLTGNGLDPDTTIGALGVQGDATVVVLGPDAGCRSGNTFATGTGFSDLPTCVLPPSLPGCPVPDQLPLP